MNEEKALCVGLLGAGVVGGGVIRVLEQNRAEIRRRTGREVKVVHIGSRDLDVISQRYGDAYQYHSDLSEVVQSNDVDVIVEVMGGIHPAKELILEAIAAGKHVVTANKALLAEHGMEIFEAASKKGVIVAFEAAIAGGIPIVKALREGLSANQIEWVAGIINGTTNYILSEMLGKGVSFHEALADAQKLGYAEADPTFDVEGIDAAHKLSLLSALAFGGKVQFDKAYIEGISQLESADIQYAQNLGYCVKLLGITKAVEEGIELRVHPTLVPHQRLISNVSGAMNAVLVQGNAVGHTLYYGQGAGSKPTASAIIADLIDIARMETADSEHQVPYLAFLLEELNQTPVLPMEEVITSYYLRLRIADKAGALAKITKIFADHQISIDAVIQPKSSDANHDAEKQADLVILTHETKEKSMNSAIQMIEALPAVQGSIRRIRKEELS